MKEKRLLYAIGWVKDEYIEEMGQPGSRKKMHRIPQRRMWLIAAIIAALLILAGCVAVFLRLQDMSIGQETYVEEYDAYGHRIEPVEKMRDVLTFSGTNGTPGYLATKEWYAFYEQYDPDGAKKPANGKEDLSIPENYRYTYYCYTPEMADRLTEIADKYDVKLLDTFFSSQRDTWKEALDGLGLKGLVHDGVEAEYGACIFYPPLNFEFNMELALSDFDASQNLGIHYVTYCYHRKDYIPGYGRLSLNLEEYQQWDYTAKDGTSLLLAMNPDDGVAFIVAEQKSAYIVVEFRISTRTFKIEGVDRGHTLTKEFVEKIADFFDYTIQPQPVDADTLEPELARVEAQKREEKAQLYQKETYADFAGWLKEHHYGDSYAFYDLDGDGKEEMLIGDGNGLIVTYLTVQNDQVLEYPPTLPDGARLLENGGISYWEEPTQFDANFTCYFYHPFAEGKTLQFADDQINTRTGGNAAAVRYEQQKWYSGSFSSWKPEWNPITEEEARAILEQYSQKVLQWQSLEDYPIDASGKTLGEYLLEQDAAMSEAQRMELLRQRAEQMRDQFGCNYYLLRDIDGDGKQELLLSQNGKELMFAFDVRYGEITSLLHWTRGYLCEDNIIEEVEDYFREEEGQQIFRTYVSFAGENRQELAFVYENVTNGTWSDNMDQRPITEAEARAIQESFPHAQMEMKLVTDWNE